MTDPFDPYRPPAKDLTEEPAAALLPGLVSVSFALGALALWFLLRFMIGWSFLGFVVGGATGVAGARGFSTGLRALHAEPPPRAGRALVVLTIAVSGLVGALGGLLALVSLAASLGNQFDYTK